MGSNLACPRPFPAAMLRCAAKQVRCGAHLHQRIRVLSGAGGSIGFVSRLCLSVSAILSVSIEHVLHVVADSDSEAFLFFVVLFCLSRISAAAHVRGSEEGEGGVAAGTAQERSWLRSPPGSYPGTPLSLFNCRRWCACHKFDSICKKNA